MNGRPMGGGGGGMVGIAIEIKLRFHILRHSVDRPDVFILSCEMLSFYW